jgi:putative tryptophan/tyrosine transport system substrate-binding protein
LEAPEASTTLRFDFQMKCSNMKRRDFITLLGGAVTWPGTVRAQQTVPVVALIFSGTASSATAPYVTAFKLGLEAVGFIEGRNVAVKYYWPGGHDEGLPSLIAELLQRQVAVIVGDTSPAMAAKKATSTTPIVFLTGTDPVKLGLVTSFSHPGGNATGVSFMSALLEAKRLGLLHELLPRATLINALVDPNYPTSAGQIKDLRDAAGALRLQIDVLQVSNDSQLNDAFATFANLRPDGLVVSASAFFATRMNQIIELAVRNSLPIMWFAREFPMAGGLISYGATVTDVFRQAGVYTGNILKGQRPAEMPVLQPTKFELVINLKTANALGLDVPPSLLAIADEVIE